MGFLAPKVAVTQIFLGVALSSFRQCSILIHHQACHTGSIGSRNTEGLNLSPLSKEKCYIGNCSIFSFVAYPTFSKHFVLWKNPWNIQWDSAGWPDTLHIDYRCNFYLFFIEGRYFWWGLFPKAKNVACVQKFYRVFTPQFPIKISPGFKFMVKNNSSLRSILLLQRGLHSCRNASIWD